MNLKTLPVLSSELFENDITVDMSDLRFPTDEDKQIRSAFIFIRNTGLKATYDFSKCSYEMKQKYLLMYMEDRFDVIIPELALTWIAIIGVKWSDMSDISILTKEEIDDFCGCVPNLIEDVRNLAASLPICSIEYFCKQNNIDVGDIEKTDYRVVNSFNFFQLLEYPYFIRLVKIMDGYTPKYYQNYFIPGTETYCQIITKFSYFNILNFIYNSTEEDIDNMVKTMMGNWNRAEE